MAQVDVVIANRLSSGVPLVGQVAKYIISAGGKRLRPVILLLTCGALNYQDAHKFSMAAVVEFIHTATLLHDDVVDESTLRRGRPTANESFGNPASVLVGDFLYSRAFQMMVEAGSMRIMHVLANATNIIAEGEVLQLMNMHDASLDEEAYLLVIRSKTAKLFEASARLAAILAQSSSDIEEACATYGQALGTAFQVIDDVLDYEGNAAEMGKNLGDDRDCHRQRDWRVGRQPTSRHGRSTTCHRCRSNFAGWALQRCLSCIGLSTARASHLSQERF